MSDCTGDFSIEVNETKYIIEVESCINSTGINNITLSPTSGANIEINTCQIPATHPVITPAANQDNSGNVFVQDIFLDSNGHVTGLFSTGVNFSGYAQSGDNISIFLNDAGYITGLTETGLNTFITGATFNCTTKELLQSLNDGTIVTGDLSCIVVSGNNISLLSNDSGYATTGQLSSTSGHLQGQIDAIPADTNTFVSGVQYNTAQRDIILTRTDSVTLTGNLDVVVHSGDNVSKLSNDAGYITGYTETDPIFSASPANSISTGDISNWNEAYGWGDHSTSGYLVSGDNISVLNNDVPYAISGSHIDVNAASDSDNSGQVFIQDILVDEYGHVTGLATATASGQVYTDGTGLVLVGNQFNIDETVIQSGDNISLLNNDAGYITTGVNTFVTGVTFNSGTNNLVLQRNDSATITGQLDGVLVSGTSYHISVNGTGVDSGGRTYVQDILVDSYGHITGITTATETGIDTNTEYTDGTGLSLNGTEFNIDSSVVQTGDNISVLNNDAGYITGFTETLTSLTGDSVNTKLVYTDENGVANDVDLSWAMDDTNLSRLVSGSIDSSGIATFTRDDTSSFTVDFSVLFDDTNLSRITSGNFDTSSGILTLTRELDDTSISVDFDGRYATTGELSSVSGYLQEQIDGVDTNTNTFVTGISYSSSSHELVLTRNSGSVTGTLENVAHSGDNISIFINDSGYINTETDPIFTGSVAYNITSENTGEWTDAYNWVTGNSGTILSSGDNVSLLVNDAGYLTGVVDDTTPKLGGNLDAQSNQITDVSKIEIANTSTDDSLLITTTEDSSSAAPVLTFKRNSSTPDDGDYIGQLKFKGENDADQEVIYAKVTAKISDASDTTEDGLIEFALRKAGSNNIGMRLTSTQLKLLNGTEMDMGSQQIHNVLDPTSPQDAATKNYCDTNDIYVTGVDFDHNTGFLVLSRTGAVDISGSLDNRYPNGNGTANYVAKWSSSKNISTGIIYDDGTAVGIGTSSPALQSAGEGLHINATGANAELKFTNSVTNSSATDGTALVASSSSFTINNREAGALNLNTNNTNAVSIDSAQRVGIGTATPSRKLDVDGNAQIGGLTMGSGVFSTGFPGITNTNSYGDLTSYAIVAGPTQTVVNGQQGVFVRLSGDATKQYSINHSSAIQTINSNQTSYRAGSTVFNELSGNIDFKIHTNNTHNTFYIDGATHQVGIGTNSIDSADVLNVNGSAMFSGTRPVHINVNGAGEFISKKGDSGGWAFDIRAIGNSGTIYSGLGFYGSNDALLWQFWGGSYQVPWIKQTTTETVVNETAANRDFRVEGQAETHLIFADASNSNVGIGQSAPKSRLTVTADANDEYGIRLGNAAGGGGSVTGISKLGLDHWAPTLNHPAISLTTQETSTASYSADLLIQTRTQNADVAPITRYHFLAGGRLGVGGYPTSKGAGASGLVDVYGPVLARGGVASNQTSAGALDFAANVLRVRSWGSGAGQGEMQFRVAGGGGGIDSACITLQSGLDMIHHGDAATIAEASSYALAISSSAATLAGNRFQILSSETVVNQAGGSLDFRVEGNADTSLLHVDASADNVGIGTNTPAYKLDVSGTFSADSINVNDAFTLPTGDGTDGQVMTTDGSGNVSWTNQSGSAGGVSSASYIYGLIFR